MENLLGIWLSFALPIYAVWLLGAVLIVGLSFFGKCFPGVSTRLVALLSPFWVIFATIWVGMEIAEAISVRRAWGYLALPPYVSLLVFLSFFFG